MNLVNLWTKFVNDDAPFQKGKTFEAITYNVMPLTANSGICEFVPNSQTLVSIENNGKNGEKQTILQYLFSLNDNSNINDSYVKSLVSYTIISYFLKVGDRHRNNIMMTGDGKIFHIDFDFILGNNAHMRNIVDGKILLEKEMFDPLNAERHALYIELLSKSILKIRSRYVTMYSLLTVINEPGEIHAYVKDACSLNQNDDTLLKTIPPFIEYCTKSSSVANVIHDTWHNSMHAESVKKAAVGAVSTATGLIGSIYSMFSKK